MTIPALLTHPTTLLICKMLMAFGVLLVVSKLKLSAKYQAMIWRVGLLLLIAMPVINQQLSMLNIAVVTDAVSSTEAVVPDFSTDFSKQPINQTHQLLNFNFLAVFFVVTVGMGLLTQILMQLRQLKHLTQQATPETDPTRLQLIKQTAQQLRLKRMPKVLHTFEIKSPATWGLFKPVILLPTAVAREDDMRIILLHEMAHIKRSDWIWMISAQLLTALFWFNPLLWSVKHRLITSFEEACDEMVLQHQVKPSQYAETLLHFHNPHSHHSHIATAMAQPSQMYQRLQLILNPTQRNNTMKKNQQHLILAGSSIALFLIASSQLSLAHDQPAPPASVAPQHETTPADPLHTRAPETPTPSVFPSAPAPEAPAHVDKPTIAPTAPLPTAAQFPTLHANELPLEMQLKDAKKMGIPLEKLEQRFELAHKRIEHANQDIHPARSNLNNAEQKLRTEELRLHARLKEAKQHELRQHRALSQKKQLRTERTQAINAQRSELQQQLQTSKQEIRTQQQALAKINEQVKKQQLEKNQHQAEEVVKLKQELAKTKVELAAAKEALKKAQ